MAPGNSNDPVSLVCNRSLSWVRMWTHTQSTHTSLSHVPLLGSALSVISRGLLDSRGGGWEVTGSGGRSPEAWSKGEGIKKLHTGTPQEILSPKYLLL